MVKPWLVKIMGDCTYCAARDVAVVMAGNPNDGVTICMQCAAAIVSTHANFSVVTMDTDGVKVLG